MKKKTERICMVPSCGAVLKKDESGLCKGCDKVATGMSGNPWIGGWGPR
jgi:hypothetical protein